MLRGWNLGRRIDILFARKASIRSEYPMISFSFDDFPHSAVSNGARILEQYGARGTFYAAGSFCGRIVNGIAQYTAEDLVAVHGAGHEIGCHTFNHRKVSKLARSELIKEVTLNASFISDRLPGAVMRTFAYPYGDVSFMASRRLERLFSACRGTGLGLNKGVANLGRLNAVRLYSGLLAPENISCLIQQAVAENSWLIFYTHDVDENPSKYGCTPQLFEHAVESTVSAGVRIEPVGEAISLICDRSCA
jgi:peptidoglycan/xylan/chitin deacetylase (PgdA/CDA1 family)